MCSHLKLVTSLELHCSCSHKLHSTNLPLFLLNLFLFVSSNTQLYFDAVYVCIKINVIYLPSSFPHKGRVEKFHQSVEVKI